ncbi:spore coat protein CotJB [Alicyclobacillus sp. TC]|uniref:Spore coat protein JB n=3 Tax=Alicyclobacillaceae TaxID=186823 RepID=A0A1M6KHK4_9BACL|nr:MULTISPECIES: spore coat protein CotJB [Alicyclobacillus]MDP9727210.1 spore coat protein JB [Alicyclobacillus tengchongensis]QRF22971.1 spore coat protein CotJB [Alicyclobacillus sp. TC]SHJ58397.1 spore coat protein JB [Alicyclobacillus montanus]
MSVSSQYYHYLQELQAVDFVLVDLTLYLDTHPNDSAALAQFQQFQKRKANLMSQFEAKFGPLQQYGNSPTGESWAWSNTPWPWQI